MGADRSGRAPPIAAFAVVVSLLALVVAANLLWHPPVAPANSQRLPSSVSPFPEFSVGTTLYVVPVDPDANLSTRLTLLSIQGLANRRLVEVYLDVRGELADSASMLSYVRTRYDVAIEPLSVDEALARYLPTTAGLVAYDSARPESVNIATMLAALRGAALAGPDTVGHLSRTYGAPILFEYATSDWAGLDPVAAYDRALRELYPAMETTLLSILPPDRWAIRDYVVATRTFVFYHPQGALATPAQTAATVRILRAAPRGIPVLGWFDSPTLTEENSFVQIASREGKFLVGVQDVPNLSVLTALGRGEVRLQRPSEAPPAPLEAKTYVALAVPDGDNLDFATGRMYDLWRNPARGTVPIAWSVNPLLADLAPPILDRYYETMSASDRFVAAPSGAGYLFPDYAGPGDLGPYLRFSRRYLEASNLDIVWLLNAFTASEVPYSSATLSAYVDALRPYGIVLDYDDQPRSADAWMHAGSVGVAPVVRSTHFWTTRENVLGKFEAARAAWGAGPQFVWLTIYPFRFDLNEALDLVDEMARRADGNLELVSPTDFFRLLRESFLERAERGLVVARTDPFAPLFSPYLTSAEARVTLARTFAASGNADAAAYLAYLAIEDLRAISVAKALLLSFGLVAIAIAAALFVSRRRGEPRLPSPDSVRAAALVAAGMALFLLALRSALAQNFWTYASIILGMALAGFHRPLRRHLDRAYAARSPFAAGTIALAFVGLSLVTSAAFPLAMLGVALALDAGLSRERVGPCPLVLGFAVGAAAGFVLPLDGVAAALLGLVLLLAVGAAPAAPARGSPPTVQRALLAGILLVLPLAAFAVASSYRLGLALDLSASSLVAMSSWILLLAAVLAIAADRIVAPPDPHRALAASLGLAAIAAGLALLVRGTVATTLALLSAFALLAFAAIQGLRGAERGRGGAYAALVPAFVLTPLLVAFLRMPPVVYSLTIAPLPEVVEYALYAPLVLVGAACLVLAPLGWIRGRRRGRAEKDFPEESHGGSGGT